MKPRYKMRRNRRGGWSTDAYGVQPYYFSRYRCGSGIDLERSANGKAWTARYRPTTPAGVPIMTYQATGRTLQEAAAAVQSDAEFLMEQAVDELTDQALGPQTAEEALARWTRPFSLPDAEGNPHEYRRCNRCRRLFDAGYIQHHDDAHCRRLQEETAA